MRPCHILNTNTIRHIKAAVLLCRRLTAAAHARYLKGNTFYTVAQLAGKQACCPDVVHLLPARTACHAAQSCSVASREAKHAYPSLVTWCTSWLSTYRHAVRCKTASKALPGFAVILHPISLPYTACYAASSVLQLMHELRLLAAIMGSHLSVHSLAGMQDVDQRVTRDIERLCIDLAELIPTMVSRYPGPPSSSTCLC